MKAAVLTNYEKIEIQQHQIYEPTADEILIKVMFSGICGSDVAAYLGYHPNKVPPIILGHEYAGIVTAVGSNITGVQVGDRVCSAAYAYCQKCSYCQSERYHLCDNKSAPGVYPWQGSFAEYVIAKKNQFFLLPKSLSYLKGALIEPLSIGIHAVRLINEAYNKACIIGCGNIGIACLIAANRMGYNNFDVIDVNQNKSHLAEHFGAGHYYTIADHHLLQRYDTIIVTSGHSEALSQALSLIKKGGKIILVAYFKGNQTCNLNAFVQNQITLIGSALATPNDFETALSYINLDEIDFMPWVTQRVGLDDLEVGLKMMTNPQAFPVAKIMIDFSLSGGIE